MREAQPADVDELEEMENNIFPDNSMNARTLLNELRCSKCFVAEREGRIAGYILARVEGDLVDILRVGVRPEFHRQGIARKLMEWAIPLANKAVLLVRKGNDPAIKLYISLEFRIVGHLLNDDSWLMLRG
jgi:ribosomal protein S18 acetylase RimI-like enzyme